MNFSGIIHNSLELVKNIQQICYSLFLQMHAEDIKDKFNKAQVVELDVLKTLVYSQMSNDVIIIFLKYFVNMSQKNKKADEFYLNEISDLYMMTHAIKYFLKIYI